MKCEGCGLESSREDIFRPVPRSFSRKTRNLCPRCFQQKDDSVYRFFFWCSIAFCIAGTLLILLFPETMWGAFLLNFAFIEIFTILCVVLHELGHVFAARMVGIKPFGIEIGRGRIVWQFLLWGFRWQFRSLPVGGCAHLAAQTVRWYRVRESIAILGGPAVNILLLILGLQLIPGELLSDFSFTKGVNPGSMLSLTNAVIILYSLWPHMVETSYGKIPNDLLLLWQTWRMPKHHIEHAPASYYFYESQECRARRDYQKAQESAERGLAQFPGHYYLEMSAGLNLLELRKYGEARQVYVRLLGRWSKQPELRFALFNNIAWATVHMGDKELLWQADACSRIALEQMPWAPYLKGTRGTVLLALGREDDATPLLQEALRETPEEDSQAIVACYLGVAYSRLQNISESRAYFALARKLNPRCSFLELETKP